MDFFEGKLPSGLDRFLRIYYSTYWAIGLFIVIGLATLVAR